jgi:VanZ family protein
MDDRIQNQGRLSWGWLGLAVGGLVVVLVLTHIPQQKMPVELNWLSVDKLIHAVAYGGLTFLFLLAFGLPCRLRILVPIAVCMLVIGALDEWTQSFVGRSTSIADWMANAIGIIVVIAALPRLRSLRSGVTV